MKSEKFFGIGFGFAHGGAPMGLGSRVPPITKLPFCAIADAPGILIATTRASRLSIACPAAELLLTNTMPAAVARTEIAANLLHRFISPLRSLVRSFLAPIGLWVSSWPLFRSSVK